jgi:nitrate reductase gamma subunit
MKIVLPLVAVLALALVGLAGARVPVVAVILPYAAAAVFLGGMIWRVTWWARSPVPFRIPTTCGQQRSLPWIRPARIDNPYTGIAAALRVLLEVVAFRSLFRNSRARVLPDGRVVYGSDKLLWAAALAFHLSFAVVLLRHARFFFDPAPRFVQVLQEVDGFFAVGVPSIYLTSVLFVAGLLVLLGRRLLDARIRYLSLPADHLPLLLLLGIAATGLLLRHVTKTDLVAVKTLGLSLASFHPQAPVGASPVLFAHVVLVCALAAWFPFSKLVHVAGTLLSPTRNLANDSRARRHENPWNPQVGFHTYAEWEHEFHDKLVEAGIPLDGESPDR